MEQISEVIEACRTGNLDYIKKISPNYYYNDICSHCEQMFILACSYKYEYIVQYFVNLYKTHVGCHKISNLYVSLGFENACINGHIHLVVYLANLYKINPDYSMIYIDIHNNSYFRYAYKYKHIHVMKYLIKLHKTNANYNIINIHNICINFNDIDITQINKYLSSLGNNRINMCMLQL
jgi:hypothetical protein